MKMLSTADQSFAYIAAREDEYGRRGLHKKHNRQDTVEAYAQT